MTKSRSTVNAGLLFLCHSADLEHIIIIPVILIKSRSLYICKDVKVMVDFEDQIPFEGVEFAENPEPRCPCLLLLDTSSSMKGEPIAELNDGIVCFKDELMADEMAVKRVEVAIINFGPVNVVNDFETSDVFQPPQLKSSGHTPMGEAIEKGIEMIKKRKEMYKGNGISYYRPWIFLITDGAPTDHWHKAETLIKEGEEDKTFMFFAVGVKGANMDILRRLSIREPLRLKELRFRDLFTWLSNSLSMLSSSNPGDAVPLENPASPEGWAVAD